VKITSSWRRNGLRVRWWWVSRATAGSRLRARRVGCWWLVGNEVKPHPWLATPARRVVVVCGDLKASIEPKINRFH